MDIRYDTTFMMAEAVGPEHGIADEELTGLESRIEAGHEALLEGRASGRLAWMDLPSRTDLRDEVLSLAATTRERYRNVVVLGIGGSALGNITLQTALGEPFRDLAADDVRGGPRVFVLDNVDPGVLGAFLDTVDPAETCFNVISKSGGTAETVAQFLVVRGVLRDRIGDRFGEHVVVTTRPEGGLLRELAMSEGYASLPVPEGVGGRFSGLSPVGLFSAACAGIDVAAVLEGAAAMDRRTSAPSLRENPAYLAAALHYLMDVRKDKRLSVLMPYGSALGPLAFWYRQLWAESLGKARGRTGELIHVGPTPIAALGATDQHSQVQLYVEGPADKVFTFVVADEPRREVVVPKDVPDRPESSYLAGRGLGELLRAEYEGTRYALLVAGRPSATISMPLLDARNLGGLLFLLEVTTAMSGELYDIDAFDQPGVEGGKQAAFALMGRPGFEEKRREIEERLRSLPRRVL
jgi:glucose-6-phosphate isomerase